MERKLRKGFCKVPNFIAWADLSGTALKLYVFLASLSPKFRTIRNIKLMRLGMSINTLQRAKKELVKRKVLNIHKREGGSNYYELLTPNPTQFLGKGYTQIWGSNPPQKLLNSIILDDNTTHNKRLKIKDINKLKEKFKSFKKL
jgi:hypothetical protein